MEQKNCFDNEVLIKAVSVFKEQYFGADIRIYPTNFKEGL